MSAPGFTSSDAGQELLRERLSRYGTVGGLLAGAYYVFINLLPSDGPGPSWLGDPANRCTLLILVVFAGMALACRKGALRDTLLGALDAVGTLAVCGLCSLHALLSLRFEHTGPYVAMISVAFTLVFRAAVVPSTPRRTAWLAVPCAAFGLLPGLLGPWPLDFDSAVLLIWAPVAVVASVATSQTVYGLRREVEEARRLGQYVLEEKIGEGGMGEVYRASHVLLRRPTAVKLLRAEKAGEESIARFEREVRMTSRLTHPNTVAIYDYGRTPQGVFYYAMELLPGLNLETLVREDGPQPPGRVVRILSQCCGSLAEAHALGLVHRDIKPANLLLCERGGIPDAMKVVDFGLVKDTRGASLPSEAGTVSGTPLYMSPESIESPDRVDARADLYALGAVGYYLLTGVTVFDGADLRAVFEQQVRATPIPPSVRSGRPVPESLERLILDCLQKDPAKRPLSALALAESLERCPGLTPWTQADAAAWWKRRADRKSAPSAPPVPSGWMADVKTLVIDVAHRTR